MDKTAAGRKKAVSDRAKSAEAALTTPREGVEAEGTSGGNYHARFDQVVTTGSTLLDLCIAGGKLRGGGVPGGILVEIFGPSGAGKSALLTTICASAQARGGEATFKDPEGRLDKEYAAVYGAKILAKDYNYSRPDTVVQVFEEIRDWDPKNPEAVNAIGVDSLAALSTEIEMTEEDKRGQKRAKDFSQELRKTCRDLVNKNWLLVCANQIRQGDYGDYAPGGKAIEFYSSVRLKVKFAFPGSQIERSIKLAKGGEEERVEDEQEQELKKKEDKKKKKEDKQTVTKIIGIKSSVEVVKSTVDDPYRSCDVYIIFGYGVHDVMGNLQWLKDTTGATSYTVDGSKSYVGIDQAINYVTDNGLEEVLRNRVIDLWQLIEKKFHERVRQPVKRL